MEDRESLEARALEEVCACQYYDLADTIDETPDGDLLSIINHKVRCNICAD